MSYGTAALLIFFFLCGLYLGRVTTELRYQLLIKERRRKAFRRDREAKARYLEWKENNKNLQNED